MKTKALFTAFLLCASATSFAGITQFQIPYGQRIENKNIDGTVTVDLNSSKSGVIINKSFYGVDTHGFSQLPSGYLVTPLQLGYVKFGGSFHSVYNWELNSYYDGGDGHIAYVYSPLERRLRFVQENYKATPMFSVNMLGWMPTMDSTGKLEMTNTATAEHAGKAISYINGVQKIGLKDVVMGNEPFQEMEIHGKPSPSADEYIAKYIDYVMAIRKAQEKISGNGNDLKIWGPEIATGWIGWQTAHPLDCAYTYSFENMKCSYGNGKFDHFIPYFLSKISEFEHDKKLNPKGYKMLDYLTFHYYPLFRKKFEDPGSIILDENGKQDIKGFLRSTNLWDREDFVNTVDSASPRGMTPKLIKRFQEWSKKYYPDCKIAVTEFGVDSMDKIAYHPIVRPLYLADLVARIGNSGVSTFIDSFLQGGEVKNNWGLINGDQQSQMYYIYQLFTNNYLGSVLKTMDTYNDAVNVYSTKDAVNTNIVIVNKDARAHNASVSLINNTFNGTDVADIKLPGWGMTIMKVPHKGGKITVLQYGAKEMGVDVDPYYEMNR